LHYPFFNVGIFFILKFSIGQVIPADLTGVNCVTPGECIRSLLLSFWDAKTTQVNEKQFTAIFQYINCQECLDFCKADDDCAFFTYWEDFQRCEGYANCVELSTDSCTNCFSGSEECDGGRGLKTDCNVIIFS